jgi:hypothetical protein
MWEVRSFSSGRSDVDDNWWCGCTDKVKENKSYPPGAHTLKTQAEAEMWCEILNANPERINELRSAYDEAVRSDTG